MATKHLERTILFLTLCLMAACNEPQLPDPTALGNSLPDVDNFHFAGAGPSLNPSIGLTIDSLKFTNTSAGPVVWLGVHYLWDATIIVRHLNIIWTTINNNEVNPSGPWIGPKSFKIKPDTLHFSALGKWSNNFKVRLDSLYGNSIEFQTNKNYQFNAFLDYSWINKTEINEVCMAEIKVRF